MNDTILKRFENPDQRIQFQKGTFETVQLGGMTIGRATYESGWKWSEHVGKGKGLTHCAVEHVGMVLSGCATAAMLNGTIHEMRAADVFFVPPGHNSWVVGDETYVSLHFLGAESYAR